MQRITRLTTLSYSYALHQTPRVPHHPPDSRPPLFTHRGYAAHGLRDGLVGVRCVAGPHELRPVIPWRLLVPRPLLLGAEPPPSVRLDVHVADALDGTLGGWREGACVCICSLISASGNTHTHASPADSIRVCWQMGSGWKGASSSPRLDLLLDAVDLSATGGVERVRWVCDAAVWWAVSIALHPCHVMPCHAPCPSPGADDVFPELPQRPLQCPVVAGAVADGAEGGSTAGAVEVAAHDLVTRELRGVEGGLGGGDEV